MQGVAISEYILERLYNDYNKDCVAIITSSASADILRLGGELNLANFLELFSHGFLWALFQPWQFSCQ